MASLPGSLHYVASVSQKLDYSKCINALFNDHLIQLGTDHSSFRKNHIVKVNHISLFSISGYTYFVCGVEWCGVVWSGVEWCGVVWSGVEWCGVVWSGVEWCGVVWCGGVEWSGVEWCGVVWCGVCVFHKIYKKQRVIVEIWP